MVVSSFSFPNMFDVARSKVNLYTDTKSLTNRVKLLLLTEPTELYMNPNFGVGLKKYMFTYNNENTISMIRDELIEQLRLWEPGVIAEETTVTRGTTAGSPGESETDGLDPNHLQITVTLTTAFMQTVSFGIDSNDYASMI